MKKARPSSNSAETSQILGIDFGSAKVGLALASAETKIAFAHSTLPNDKNFFSKLKDLIEKENISQIVIGIPSRINREKTVYEGERLGNLLRETFPEKKIAYQNEMFSTKIAQINLKNRGVRNIKRFDDQEAARVILQSWLDS